MQDTIAVHWEAAPPRADHARCAQQVEEIRSYHRKVGYSDIAYSWLVCNHGQVFTGRGWDRQSAATCNSHWNARAWSVCWMGGPGHSPTPPALAGIRSVIDQARARGAHRVIGHRDACATECPGAELHRWVHSGFPATPAPPPPPPPRKDQSMAATYFEDQPVIFETTDDGALRHGYIKNGKWVAVNLFKPGWCKPGARPSVAVRPDGGQIIVSVLAAPGHHSHIAARNRGGQWVTANDA